MCKINVYLGKKAWQVNGGNFPAIPNNIWQC